MITVPHRLRTFFAGSVRKQLIWGVALVHAVMMTLFVHDLTIRQHDFLLESQTEDAGNLADTLSLTAISPMLASDLSGLQELTAAVGKYPGVAFVMAIHHSGKVLAHSDSTRRGQFVADSDQFPKQRTVSPVLISRNETLVDVVMPVISSDTLLGWVRVGVGQGSNNAKLQAITTTGLWYTALAIIAGAFIAWMMASGLTRRLTGLRKVADDVSGGNMRVRAPSNGNDELSHLSRTFNFMLDALSARAEKEALLQSELHREKVLAEVTLASIGEAVITTDVDGAITFLNQVAERLTGWRQGDALGLPLGRVYSLINARTRQSAPISLEELSDSINTSSSEDAFLLVSRSGDEISVAGSISWISGGGDKAQGAVLVFRDISEQRHFQQKLEWQAGHDPLTALPNRLLLSDRFARALESTKRNGTMLAVCVLDLDNFKPVNDLHGHHMGDRILLQVTDRLRQELRACDTLSRLGGDEFVLLFEDVQEPSSLHIPLERIRESLASPFELGHTQINISASIGVTFYPQDDTDADTLVRHADQAMYQAKQAGRNQVAWFDVHQNQHEQAAYKLIADVRKALGRNHLELFYQPKVDMRNGTVIGMEALLRWRDPVRGLIPPGEFLPQIENSQLIVDIGRWVVRTALSQAVHWVQAGKRWPVSVNIAARHLQTTGFISELQGICSDYPEGAAQLLEIEVLESAALHDVEQARSLIMDGQALGFAFSLDDFGTGYSSLKYLKRLPVNTLKIDQAFVRDILDHKDDMALVGAVIGLANAFERKVIAEGVETDEHATCLIEMGCPFGQGYGIAKPMPANEVLDWSAQYSKRFRPETGELGPAAVIRA